MLTRIFKFIYNHKYKFGLLIIAFFMFVFVVSPAYAKFSVGYVTEDDMVGFNFDFNIGIDSIYEYETIQVDAKDAVIFNVNIDNNSIDNMYYGVWYRVLDEVDDDNFVIAKLADSESPTSGMIKGSGSVVVSIIIKNNTNSNIKVDFGVMSSEKSVEAIEYLDGRKLISGVEEIIYLSEVENGSYVNYVGNNGCDGNFCLGQNINYVDDKNKGYCYNDTFKYNLSGFRVAYVSNNTAYLISAGAVGCVSTNSLGEVYYNEPKIDSFEKIGEESIHIDNLNLEALHYCNKELAYGGICNDKSSWNFNAEDFSNIVGAPLTLDTCYSSKENIVCGYKNDLLDIGSYYWISSRDGEMDNNNFFYWDADKRYVGSADSSYGYGLRPVLRMASSVYIVGGTGTYDDPYWIVNRLVEKSD